MNMKINELLARLAHEPLDHSLTGLERDIGLALRKQRPFGFLFPVFGPLQVAALSIALIVGITVGGMSGASSIAASKSHLFIAEEKLALSTILEGG